VTREYGIVASSNSGGCRHLFAGSEIPLTDLGVELRQSNQYAAGWL